MMPLRVGKVSHDRWCTLSPLLNGANGQTRKYEMRTLARIPAPPRTRTRPLEAHRQRTNPTVDTLMTLYETGEFLYGLSLYTRQMLFTFYQKQLAWHLQRIKRWDNWKLCPIIFIINILTVLSQAYLFNHWATPGLQFLTWHDANLSRQERILPPSSLLIKNSVCRRCFVRPSQARCSALCY